MVYELLVDESEGHAEAYLLEEGFLGKPSLKHKSAMSLNDEDETISDDLDKLMQ